MKHKHIQQTTTSQTQPNNTNTLRQQTKQEQQPKHNKQQTKHERTPKSKDNNRNQTKHEKYNNFKATHKLNGKRPTKEATINTTIYHKKKT